MDLWEAINFFDEGGLLPQEVNHSFITLVLKIKSAFQLSKFRPIACCNVFYKIISKIFSNRLQKVILVLILSLQSACIKGRLISDNILLAHELVRGFSRSCDPARAALNIDIKKAYDTVRRSFLWKVLEVLEFS